jgi:formyl-CoA transferase
MSQPQSRALQGLKVIELGQLIAGPFAGKFLAEFGAEVIKVEPPASARGPGGDPLRTWRKLHQGTSLWWYVQNRNKQSLTADLRVEEGRELVRRLAREADVVIENFKPGTLEKWGLDHATLAADNPGLIMLRLSGFGQTGPMKDLGGFGIVGEAMGGLRHITGFPDRAPVRPNLSIGDGIAALHGVIGVLVALQHRHRTGRGQVVDVALYEAVFNMMESLVPEYDMYGTVRERTGTNLTGIVPSNTYPTADGTHVVIGGNGDSIFKRLMAAIDRADLAEDPGLGSNAGRVPRADEIDAAIAAWTSRHPADEVLRVMGAAQVPSGKIYTVADIVRDPQYLARGMLQTIELPDGTPLKVPGIVPRLSETPGSTGELSPALGAHTDRILRGLGITDEQIAAMRDRGVI